MPDRSNSKEGAAALFLDRDDTLIVDIPYLRDPDRVVLLPGAREALRLARRTHRLFLFTNQSGIGRGYYTMAQAEAVNQRMIELLDLPPPLFDAICIAPEAPEQPPHYRKPSPRFILECIERFKLDPRRCWMVGDRISDLQAGARAGIQSVLVTLGRATGGRLGAYLSRNPTAVYHSLLDFVESALCAPGEKNR